MLCIHLGPGRLGLGLIVEQLGQSQQPVCVIGPPSSLERRIRESASAEQEAIELLQRSLQLRPGTPRDHRSRGMAEGDLLVLSGEREAGAELLTKTVENFKPDLMRHYESAREMLIARDLLRAA